MAFYSQNNSHSHVCDCDTGWLNYFLAHYKRCTTIDHHYILLQPSGYNLISISELKRIFIFTVHLMNILEIMNILLSPQRNDEAHYDNVNIFLILNWIIIILLSLQHDNKP